jgi:raffinose/stachyose/melibiose transport system substrate-binding protein
MKTKKLLSIITSGLLLASLLTGCTSTPASTNGGTSSKEVHLKLFIGQGQARFKEQYTKYFDQFAAKYEKEKGVKVTYDLEMPDANTSDQLLKTRLAGGDDMDIFAVHAANQIPDFGKAGYLEDLNDQPFASKIIEKIKGPVSYNGKIVAVPLENSSWGYIYNKKIFKDNNITVPTTLSELKAVTAQLKAKGITPWLLSYKDSWVPQLVNSLAVGAYVNTTDKDFIDRMNKGQGSYKEIQGMFDVMDLINANGTPKPLDLGADPACGDFANGKAAMWLQGPWESAQILKDNPNFELGVAALPISDDPSQTMVNLGVSTSLALSTHSKNKEVAKALLNYMYDDQDSAGFFQACQFAPVATIHNYKVESFVEDATAYVKAGKAYVDPSMPQAVKDEVGKALQGYYLKSMSKDDVIKDLDKVWADSVKASK